MMDAVSSGPQRRETGLFISSQFKSLHPVMVWRDCCVYDPAGCSSGQKYQCWSVHAGFRATCAHILSTSYPWRPCIFQQDTCCIWLKSMAPYSKSTGVELVCLQSRPFTKTLVHWKWSPSGGPWRAPLTKCQYVSHWRGPQELWLVGLVDLLFFVLFPVASSSHKTMVCCDVITDAQHLFVSTTQNILHLLRC